MSAPYMPIFVYPNGNQMSQSNFPTNTVYKWIEPLGGQTLSGPARMGDLRPDGKKGHGGVATCNNNIWTVEYHGVPK